MSQGPEMTSCLYSCPHAAPTKQEAASLRVWAVAPIEPSLTYHRVESARDDGGGVVVGIEPEAEDTVCVPRQRVGDTA